MLPPWLRYLPPLCLLLGGAVWSVRLSGALDRAEADLARREAAQTARNQGTGTGGSGALAAVDVEELGRLREAHLELLRLRGSIQDLRRNAAAAADPQAEVAALESRAAALRRDMDWKRRKREAQLEETRLREGATLAAMLVTMATQAGAGRVPTRWDDVAALAREQSGSGGNPPAGDLAGLWAHCQSESVPLQRFEILAARRRGADARTVRRPQVVLRERSPRELPPPKQGWARFYAFPEGGVEEAISADGAFLAWEREHLDTGVEPAGTPKESAAAGP